MDGCDYFICFRTYLVHYFGDVTSHCLGDLQQNQLELFELHIKMEELRSSSTNFLSLVFGYNKEQKLKNLTPTSS